MVICHICGAECEDNAELCPVCGAELVIEEAPLGETEQNEIIIIENPVLAAAVEDIITAEIFCDMLKDNKIPFSFDEESEEAGIKLLLGGAFATTNVYVDQSNLEKAEEIYKQALEAGAGDFEEFEEEDNAF